MHIDKLVAEITAETLAQSLHWISPDAGEIETEALEDINYSIRRRVYNVQAMYWRVFLQGVERARNVLSAALEAARAEADEGFASGQAPSVVLRAKAEGLWLETALEKLQGL